MNALPKAPSHLGPVGRDEFCRVVAYLDRVGIFAPAFRISIELYARTVENVAGLETLQRKHGPRHVVTVGGDRPKSVAASLRAWKAFRREQAESLGLTPRSRLQIKRFMKRNGLRSMRQWNPLIHGFNRDDSDD